MAGFYWQDQELDFQFDIISALPNPMGPSGTNAIHYNEEAGAYYNGNAAQPIAYYSDSEYQTTAYPNYLQ